MSIETAFFGTMARDGELKTSKAGKQYLRISVRVGDGDTAQFVNAMVFDPDAIEVAAKMLKGARVYVEGKLSLDEWVGQDGAKRHGLSVMSWHCRLAEIGRNRPPRRGTPQDGGGRWDQAAHAPLGVGTVLDDDIAFAPEFR